METANSVVMQMGLLQRKGPENKTESHEFGEGVGRKRWESGVNRDGRQKEISWGEKN